MEFGIDVPAEKPFDAVALGLNAVDHLIVVSHYPEFNSKVRLTSHALEPGGECATAMVALARLGLKSRYIGTVGSDDLGRFQLDWLESQGVDASRVRVVSGAETQTAFIIIDEQSGERTIIWQRDQKLSIEERDVEPKAIESGRVLLINGPDIGASVRAAKIARAAGIPVVIDIEGADAGTENLLGLVDFIISSSAFPELFTGDPDLRAALKTIQRKTGALFVAATLGKQGAVAYCHGRYVHSPGFRVDCRDTTGAGDAFHGGFIYGLLAGMSVEETLEFANAVAGLKCREVGAQTGLPSLAEVQSLLRTDGARR